MVIRNITELVTSEEQFSGTTKKLLSLIFLSIAVFFSLKTYYGTTLFFFETKVRIAPDLISGVIAISMLLPLYARGILIWRKTIYKLIVFLLLLSVFASMSKVAIYQNSSVTGYLIAAAVMLSWLGLRSVAGFGWILIFAAAILNAFATSDAMGVYGFIFIVTAFLGLVFHADLAPNKLATEILKEYRHQTSDIANNITSDVAEAGATVKEKMGNKHGV